MSASIKSSRLAAGEEKKARKAEEAAKAAAQKKKTTRLWILGIALAVIAIALIILVNGGIIFRCTTAYKVNDTKYSPAEVNYFYGEQYYTFVNTYGEYTSYFGLDTTGGISSLASQERQPMEEGEEAMTWKEYFLNSAKSSITEMKALCDYADANGITLDDEDIAQVDTNLLALEQQVLAGGYKNLNSYFTLCYGDGVNTNVVRELNLSEALAAKAYTTYNDSLEYTDEELEEYYQSLEGSADQYSYLYYFMMGDKTESTDEAGNAVSEVSEEDLAKAKEKAESVKAEFEGLFADASSDADIEELLNAALATQLDATCSHTSNLSGSTLNSDYSEWLKDSSREKGDVTVVPSSGGTGYYIIVFDSLEDNHYPTVSVRHILIKVNTNEEGAYTEEDKEAARTTAEDILAEWQNGDATEDSFAALANEYSEDPGSNTVGGLYEGIYKGQMVQNFNDFCFAGHKPGDTDIVFVENDSYTGYHIIYFVGEGELYSTVFARDSRTSKDLNDWRDGLIAACTCEDGPSLRLAA